MPTVARSGCGHSPVPARVPACHRHGTSRRQHMAFEGFDQRVAQSGRLADPGGQHRPRQLHAAAPIDPFLAIQRTEIGVLGADDLREQRWYRQSALDRPRRRRHRHARLLVAAHQRLLRVAVIDTTLKAPLTARNPNPPSRGQPHDAGRTPQSGCPSPAQRLRRFAPGARARTRWPRRHRRWRAPAAHPQSHAGSCGRDRRPRRSTIRVAPADTSTLPPMSAPPRLAIALSGRRSGAGNESTTNYRPGSLLNPADVAPATLPA